MIGDELEFEAEGGGPLRVRVERDGVRYEIRVAVVVMAVTDDGVSEDGKARFDVQANLAIDTRRLRYPAWIPCDNCEEYWCTIHEKHAFECDCPPIEEWTVDPYNEGGRRT